MSLAIGLEDSSSARDMISRIFTYYFKTAAKKRHWKKHPIPSAKYIRRLQSWCRREETNEGRRCTISMNTDIPGGRTAYIFMPVSTGIRLRESLDENGKTIVFIENSRGFQSDAFHTCLGILSNRLTR